MLMPFSLKNKKIIKTMHSPSITVLNKRKRVLSFTSQNRGILSGAITLETTLLMTVYLTVIIPLICLGSVVKTQMEIQITLENVARDMAQKAYYTSGILNADIVKSTIDKLTENTKYSEIMKTQSNPQDGSCEKSMLKDTAFTALVYSSFISKAGFDKLNDSNIVGGAVGLDFSGSGYDDKSGEITVEVSYNVKLPFVSALWGLIPDHRVVKATTWCGEDIETKSNTVYITKNSKVYHTSLECTYLYRDLTRINKAELVNIRNSSGKKYKDCKLCKTENDVVYVTKDGEKYHGSLECSAIDRDVLAVEKSEIGDMKCCSKCEKERENVDTEHK